jgi:hypothetical protein
MWIYCIAKIWNEKALSEISARKGMGSLLWIIGDDQISMSVLWMQHLCWLQKQPAAAH